MAGPTPQTALAPTDMRLLFLTRKYPPRHGGMENVSYALAHEFSAHVPTTIIAWGGSQAWLPLFLPIAFLKSLYFCLTRRITHIHLGDGLLAPLGVVLAKLTGAKVSVTIHGLDITYKNSFYQSVVPRCLARLHRIVAISQHTAMECTSRGIPERLISVIPWGVYPDELRRPDATRTDLEKMSGMDLSGKVALLTVGRFVERKGAAWFIENVMPLLPEKYVYLLLGDGVNRPAIEAAIIAGNLQRRVKLLGALPDEDRYVSYNTADIFVMPNIPVPGDVEGFGIVAIEAAITGLPVVAADLEGIADAVLPDQTGVLVPSGDARAFADVIQSISLPRNAVAEAAHVYRWDDVISKYLGVIA